MDPEDRPELPAAFELVSVGVVEDLRQTAITLANSGAEEGTVIVADNQTRAKGCTGKSWYGYKDNLHASIILQPDFDKDLDHEMLFVGVTSLGNAIAAHVSPMTALAYSWPNDINIAGNKIGSVWMDSGESQSGRWLAITCSVNVRNGPEDFSVPALSILEAEGTTDLTANTLLESWTRQFVRLINLWSEQGFDKIFTLWQVRQESIGKIFELQHNGVLQEGESVDLTPQGEIILLIADGSKVTVSPRSIINS